MDADRTDADGGATPDGQPDTTEDQRGEYQPVDGEAVEEAAEEAEAVEHPATDG